MQPFFMKKSILITENINEIQPYRGFQPGVSGNPRGKPKGALSRHARLVKTATRLTRRFSAAEAGNAWRHSSCAGRSVTGSRGRHTDCRGR